MKAIYLLPLLSLFLWGGCSTTSRQAGDFVRTTNFSQLDTFSYKHTLSTGINWRDPDQYMIEKLSDRCVTEELLGRGFFEVETGSDFYVVTKWRKALSSYPNQFQHIDGPTEALRDRERPDFRGAVRFTLVVELYETSTRNLFWRAELPNIFDALQLTEDRVEDSLRRALKNFPARVEKDPTLKTIE